MAILQNNLIPYLKHDCDIAYLFDMHTSRTQSGTLRSMMFRAIRTNIKNSYRY